MEIEAAFKKNNSILIIEMIMYKYIPYSKGPIWVNKFCNYAMIKTWN